MILDLFRMDGRVAVVTGAGRGIGAASAVALAECGADVVIASRTQGDLDQVADLVSATGRRAVTVAADLSDLDAVRRLAEVARSEFGRLDVVVNNAGMQYVANIEDFPTDKFRQIVDLMLVGSFISTKYAFPLMKKQGFGRIINMASINGLVGFAGKAAYNSAKHGLTGDTFSLFRG